MKNTFFPSKIYGDKQGQCAIGDGKSKLLPHILGQYEYRITNKLLVHKILNPRRDKLIMDSLLNASNVSCSNDKSNINHKTSYSFHKRRKNEVKKKLFTHQTIVVQPSKSNIDYQVNQFETPTFEGQQSKSMKANNKRINTANYIGRIKKNNFMSTLDLNGTIFQTNKSGHIVHQSCSGIYGRENMGEKKFLRRIKIEHKKYFSKEGMQLDDKSITYDQQN